MKSTRKSRPDVCLDIIRYYNRPLHVEALVKLTLEWGWTSPNMDKALTPTATINSQLSKDSRFKKYKPGYWGLNCDSFKQYFG